MDNKNELSFESSDVSTNYAQLITHAHKVTKYSEKTGSVNVSFDISVLHALVWTVEKGVKVLM